MRQVAGHTLLDRTMALKRDPYGFIARRCERLGTDVFETRLLLRPALCMRGAEAAKLFYDSGRFMRKGAAPLRLQATLFGIGGVQSLDGEAHRSRKQMLLSIMQSDRIARLAELSRAQLRSDAREWADRGGRIELYRAAQRWLTRAVCAWAGVPLAESEVDKRARALGAMFDAAGAIGPAHWQSRLSRARAELWGIRLVRGVRAGRLEPPEDSALHRIAWYRDPSGERLGARVAAVELLNILRPTVAVSVYIVFVALALHRYPQWRRALRDAEASDAGEPFVTWFVQEVRRFYPFFPAVVARVRAPFEWHGYRFSARRRVLLDLHGTNHDARSWEAPDEFRPERFRTWGQSAFDLIPQGGGNHERGHRCPGEWITIELMKVAARVLSSELTYTVPQQDFRVDRSRLPALPRSRFVLRDVRPS